MILHDLIKTCDACPAQWEAVNERGERVLIHYRYDTLTVYCPYGDETQQDYPAFMEAQILHIEQVAHDPLCGCLEEGEMLALTGYSLD